MAKANILTRGKKQKAFRLLEQNQFAEARPLLEQVCRADGSDAEAWFALGIVHGSYGDHKAEEDSFRRVVALHPKNADALCNLGVALEKQGDHDQAIACFKQALTITSNDPHLLGNLASALLAIGNNQETVHYGKQALKLNPNDPEVYSNIAMALTDLGQLQEAVEYHEHAIRLAPARAEFHNNLAFTLATYKQYDVSIKHARRAIAIDPRFAEAYNNLGIALKGNGNINTAIENYKTAIDLKPDYYRAMNNLGDAYLYQGRFADAIKWFKNALVVFPQYETAYTNLLLTLNYYPGSDSSEISREHENWAAIQTSSIAPPLKYNNVLDPDRPLKIGYISPDFKRHSVAFFFEPILKHHDKKNYETICFSQLKKPDGTTERLRAMADQWHSITGMPDAEAAELIHKNNIDILVDLAGHTKDNRLLVLAHKPAPVQVTYLGYPNTTGLRQVDYRITDQWADPEGAEQFHTERLVRLPTGFLCYQPLDDTPDVSSPPHEAGGYITFGSFNNLAKINEEVIGLWSKILKAVPGSKIIIKNKSLLDDAVCKRYSDTFKENKIDEDRIELIGWLKDPEGHLRLYNKIDIGLDTFPYNGTTTTCEALWMGVPIVTLAGYRHAGRVGVSLLKQLGLDELIAASEKEYIGIAENLANQKDRLKELRHGMRQRMLDSPLCDSAGFTAKLESAYREMWRQYCAKVDH